MKEKPFPILKLPLLPFNRIIKQISSMKIINLTMMSTKFKRRMETVKMKGCNLNLIISVDYHAVRVNGLVIEAFYSTNYSAIPWFFRKLDGHEVLQSRIHEFHKSETYAAEEMIIKTRDNSQQAKIEMVERIWRHLMSFIDVTPKLHCRREIKEFQNMFFFKSAENIDTLTISPYASNEVRLSPEDIIFILEKLKIVHLDLQLKCTDPQFKHLKQINYRKVIIRDFSWIDLNSFVVSPQTRILEFHELDQLKIVGTLNKIAKNWINGDGFNLESFNIYHHHRFYSSVDFEQVLVGLNSLEVFTREEVRKCAPYWVNYFKEIRRVSDGKLASIVIDKHCSVLIFWTDEKLKKIGREDLIKRTE